MTYQIKTFRRRKRDATVLAVAHSVVMEIRRTWADQLSHRSLDQGLAVQEWLRGSLLRTYRDVLREAMPQDLLDLLPEE